MKTGDKIIAIDQCVMYDTQEPSLTIGKEYEVIKVTLNTFTVIDDIKSTHRFDIDEFGEFFKLPEPKINWLTKKESTTGNKIFGSTPSYYDNTNGTIYKVQKERGWNAYVFDIVKRLERAEKKGEFLSDIDKCIKTLELYRDEQRHNFEGQTEQLNII